MTYALTAPTRTMTLDRLRVVSSSVQAGTLGKARLRTRRQAAFLRHKLSEVCTRVTVDDIARIVDLDIKYIADLPVPGIAFQRQGRWQLHISVALTPTERLQRVLHELKHVIDHPLRRGEVPSVSLSDADHETLADYFATLVLESKP